MKFLLNDINQIKQTMTSLKRSEQIAFDPCVKTIDFPYFIGNQKVSNVAIKKNISKLCPRLFEGSSIAYVSISTTQMEQLNDEMFNDCKKLKDVDASKSNIKHIGSSCFSACPSLNVVKLPSTVVSLGEKCFFGCDSLQSIDLPQQLASVGDYCFASCYELKSISFPHNVKELSIEMFNDCYSLQDVYLGQVSSIGYGCFSNCKSLRRIVVPASVKWIDDCAFSKSGIEEIVFQHTVDDNIEFGNCIFTECTCLKSICGNKKIQTALRYNLLCI